MDENFPVKVHIYDLTKGMARAMSQAFLGVQLDGVWHTGVVAYGKEYFYGGQGIENCPPGTTILGPPDSVADLGTTCLPFDLFMDWMNGMAMTTFKGSRYHLLDHNCNNFSNEMAQFLTGKSIPGYITDLPAAILATPMGQQLRVMFDQVANSATATPVGPDPSRAFAGSSSSSRPPVYDAEEEELMAAARAAVDAPMPRATVRLRDPDDSGSDTDEAFAASLPTPAERKKPIIFTNIDVTDAYAQLQRGLNGIVPPDDVEILDEIFEYATTTEENNLMLSVSKNHFTFLNDILVSEELGSNLKVQAAKLLQYLVQASSAINVLRFCAEHPLMEYLLLLGKQRNPEPAELVEALKMVCNAFNSASGSSWVTDEMEWSENDADPQRRSNVEVTVQFCAWCLGKPPALLNVQETATKLAFNLAIGDIPDHLAVLVGDTLLKLLLSPTALPEPTVVSAVAALSGFIDFNSQVAQHGRSCPLDLTALQNRYPKSKDIFGALAQKLRESKI